MNGVSPDPTRLLRNIKNRCDQLEQQALAGTWKPTAETMELVLRHTLGILQAVQLAIEPNATTCSS